MMKKIKILNIVVAKVWGGGEQYVYDTSKALAERKHKVYIAVDQSNTVLQKRFAEAGEIFTCDLYSLGGLKSIWKLSNFVKKQKIDIVNCHSGHAMLLCTLLKFLTGVKIVSFRHNALPAKHDWYHKWQRKHTDAYICVSKLVYDLQTAGLNKEEKKKYHLVYNGIDTSKFNKYQGKFTQCEKFVIGYAGRIAENKGIDILIEAFAKLSKKYSDMYLYIAGSDDKGYLEKLQLLIKKYGLSERVKFLGQVHDMEKFYKSLNVFVLPSVVKEAFGLVLCEAMYCGVPVITTDSGAQKEIIDDGIDGFIVPKGDVGKLSFNIELIYLESDKYKNFTNNATSKIKMKFSIDTCINNLISVLSCN